MGPAILGEVATGLDIAMTLSLTRPYPDPTLYRVGSGRLKYL
jgi:hypothetical protein